MSRERYETGKAPRIMLEECAGSVVVKGWGENAVAVKGEHESSAGEEKLTLRAHGSLQVRVPAGATVVATTVHGDLIVKGVEGALELAEVMGDLVAKNVGEISIATAHADVAMRQVEGPVNIDEVMGDVALRNVGAAHVRTVHGDFAARYVDGDVHLDTVMGDASLRTVAGDVHMARVHRDVNLRNLSGTVEVGEAMGDVRLVGTLTPGKHHLTALGDIVVRWPAGAALNVIATASEVRNRLPLENVEDEGKTFSGQMGEGDTTLILSAQGRVILKEVDLVREEAEYGSDWSFAADFAGMGAELAGIGAQISSEVTARVSELTQRLDERLGPEFAQKMADRAAQKTERAVRQAMRQAERTRRQADAWTPPPSQPRRSGKQESPSAEEQMKILNMLEKGIISVDEADTLLKALES